jgi:hypothetical protein
MPFELNKTWFGLGEKTGGMLIAAGMEHTTGMIVRGSNLENLFSFSITSARIGLGLGFSGGLIAIMIFNCDNIQRLQNQDVSDWGVNIALGGRWAEIARALRRSEMLVELARLGWRLRGVAAQGERLRNFLHYAYNAYDIRTMNNQPKIVTLDTPVGIGAEIAVNYSTGRISFN